MTPPQQIPGPYVADFYCHSHKLVIEVDGGQHYETHGRQRDEARDDFLYQRGIRVLRFNNLDVLERVESVVEIILGAIDPLPSPLPREGEGI